jgi:hypothetical protein
MAQFGNTEIYGTLNVAGKLITREIVSVDGFTVTNGINVISGDIVSSIMVGSDTSICLVDNAGKLKRDTWSTANAATIVVKPSSTVRGICYASGAKESGGFYGGDTEPTAGTTTRLNYEGYFYASRVYNAFWNDIADFITVEEDTEVEFGKAYTYNGKHRKTNKYGEPAIGIATDTYGFGVGMNSNVKQIPIAIGGFVLAYTNTIYKFGTPLVATKDGKLTKADFFTKVLYPERIVATFYKEETNKMYNTVEVKNRHWVKI